MTKQKKRTEINDNYKWDLTTIFKSVNEWNKEYDKVSKEYEDITKFKGHILDSKESLYEYLKFDETLERRLYKLYYYAHLNFDSDTTNSEYQNLKGKMDNLLVKVSELTSFVSPELLSKPYDVVKTYIEESDNLKEYTHSMESFYRSESHKLSEEQNKILALLSNALESPESIYESLTDSDMKFGDIEDECGNVVEFTESNWSTFSHSKNRDVRKKAFKKLFSTYGSYKNTLANTYSKNVDLLVNMAKLRKFNSSIEASLFSDNVDRKVYDNLIDSVHNNLNIAYKYFGLKKEILGLDELHMYDIYVDLVENFDKEYSFEDAKDLVIEALKPLGEDYINNLKRAFDEKWIDVYNNEGKRGGAYSSGFYDTNPYVLLNFEGKFNDVSTLAHELGHSMHTLYSCKNNAYCNHSYQIFVAEVASTVNELLLRKYLLKNTNDDNEKLYILNSIMELIKSTIIRQVMFAEFERDTHAAKENGVVLTNEYLSNKYYELNKLYFGDNVISDDLIKNEWMRIPHFYYDFYVYKYAIGLASACYIVDHILNEDGYVEKYLNFLKSGGSDYPVNELKIADVDVLDSKVIESAFKMFDDTIEEFNKIKNKR